MHQKVTPSKAALNLIKKREQKTSPRGVLESTLRPPIDTERRTVVLPDKPKRIIHGMAVYNGEISQAYTAAKFEEHNPGEKIPENTSHVIQITVDKPSGIEPSTTINIPYSSDQIDELEKIIGGTPFSAAGKDVSVYYSRNKKSPIKARFKQGRRRELNLNGDGIGMLAPTREKSPEELIQHTVGTHLIRGNGLSQFTIPLVGPNGKGTNYLTQLPKEKRKEWKALFKADPRGIGYSLRENADPSHAFTTLAKILDKGGLIGKRKREQLVSEEILEPIDPQTFLDKVREESGYDVSKFTLVDIATAVTGRNQHRELVTHIQEKKGNILSQKFKKGKGKGSLILDDFEDAYAVYRWLRITNHRLLTNPYTPHAKTAFATISRILPKASFEENYPLYRLPEDTDFVIDLKVKNGTQSERMLLPQTNEEVAELEKRLQNARNISNTSSALLDYDSEGEPTRLKLRFDQEFEIPFSQKVLSLDDVVRKVEPKKDSERQKETLPQYLTKIVGPAKAKETREYLETYHAEALANHFETYGGSRQYHKANMKTRDTVVALVKILDIADRLSPQKRRKLIEKGLLNGNFGLEVLAETEIETSVSPRSGIYIPIEKDTKSPYPVGNSIKLENKPDVSHLTHATSTGRAYKLRDSSVNELVDLPVLGKDGNGKPISRDDSYVDFAEAMQIAFGLSYEASWHYFNLVQEQGKSVVFREDSPGFYVNKPIEDSNMTILEIPRTSDALPVLLETLESFGLYDPSSKQVTEIKYMTNHSRK